MRRPIRLYVSSSPDLALEREALGRVAARLPVTTGWEIRHTPRAGESEEEALAFVSSCDLYVVLLGADFAAPMGSEWARAKAHQRLTLAFSKQVLRSPSAQWAYQQRGVEWEPFASAEELERTLIQRLAQALLEIGERVGLHVDDVDGLVNLLRELGEKEAEQPTEGIDRRFGAGRSGVILAGRGAGSRGRNSSEG